MIENAETDMENKQYELKELATNLYDKLKDGHIPETAEDWEDALGNIVEQISEILGKQLSEEINEDLIDLLPKPRPYEKQIGRIFRRNEEQDVSQNVADE